MFVALMWSHGGVNEDAPSCGCVSVFLVWRAPHSLLHSAHFPLDVHFMVFSRSSVTPGNKDFTSEWPSPHGICWWEKNVCRAALKSPVFCRTASSSQLIDLFMIIVCAAEQTAWSCCNMVNTQVLPCLLLTRHQPLTASQKKTWLATGLILPRHRPCPLYKTSLSSCPLWFFSSFPCTFLKMDRQKATSHLDSCNKSG